MVTGRVAIRVCAMLLAMLVAGASAQTPAPRDTLRWRGRHERVLQEIRGEKPALIFVGDSITQSLENHDPRFGDTNSVWRRYYLCRHAINLGFAGDTTGNAIWRLEHGEIDAISPKLAIVLIGTNDIGPSGGASPKEAAAGVRAVVGALHQHLPATRIFVLSLLPREKYDRLRRDVNRQLAGEDWAGLNAAYLDVAPLLERDGRPDPGLYRDRVVGRRLLHPNAAGWGRIAGAIEGRVAEVLKQTCGEQ